MKHIEFTIHSEIIDIKGTDLTWFQYTVTFSKTEVAQGEAFSATATATATCKINLPIAPSEASFTGRIVAVHQASNTPVTLNPSYNLSVSPFPYLAGQTTQVQQIVPLQFPDGSPFGAYNVAGELIEAGLAHH